jgi:anthranilate/para-aminobenzoate synthase component I
MAIAVVTFADPGIPPAEAFFRLRSQAVGMPAFLLESRGGGEEGRHSIVAYRVRKRETLPPWVDAIDVQAATFEAMPPQQGLAASLVEGGIGFLSASSACLHAGVQLFQDEGPAGCFGVGATVLVFDHEAGTLTVAAPATGRQLERCIYELDHGAVPPALGDLDPTALPADVRQEHADEKLVARARRAQPFLEDELEWLTLTQVLSVPCGDSDPFTAYRALRALSPTKHGYYLDFGDSAITARTCVFGASDTMLCRARGDGARDVRAALRESLPHTTTTGSPPVLAARMLRRLEDQSRQSWGGAVGYLCPGGHAGFVLGDGLVSVQSGEASCTAAVRLDVATDPATLPDAARRALSAQLAAFAVVTA